MVQSALQGGQPLNASPSHYEATEEQIREICAEVLRRPVAKIKMNKSFLAQGGDSLLAIKLMARCAEAGYNITIHDMLQATSLKKLCESLKLPETSPASSPFPIVPNESQDTALSREHQQSITIPLTGAQQIYVYAGVWDTKLFRVDGDIPEAELLNALKGLARSHPILRARIAEDAQDNRKQCLAVGEGDGSFAYETKELETGLEDPGHEWMGNGDVLSSTKQEKSLFSATVFVQRGTCLAQFLQLAIHRAVVDATSWNLIERGLEQSLATGAPQAGPPGKLFQHWTRPGDVQDWVLGCTATQHSRTPQRDVTNVINTEEWSQSHGNPAGHGDGDGLPIANGPVTEMRYAETDCASLGRLLEGDVHHILRTEPGDFVTAAVYLTLRAIAHIPADGVTFGLIKDGRPERKSGDFSETIGCFDTIARLHIEGETDESDIQLLRRIKDTRINNKRSTRAPDGSTTRAEQFVLLDLTKVQSSSGVATARLQQNSYHEMFTTLPPECLIAVEAYWERGQPRLRVVCQHPSAIYSSLNQIAAMIEDSIRNLCCQIEAADIQTTLSDFPFLDVTYPELDNLVSVHLRRITSDPLRDIEGVYPCAPRQEAFLVAQAVYPDMYQCSFVVRIESTYSDSPLDYTRLRTAWAQLVERHAALRTVFIESANRPGHFDQVVLKNGTSTLTYLDDGDERTAHELSSRRPVIFKNYQCTHQVALCETSPYSIYLRLDMSHAVVDGQSAQVLLRDLSSIYSDQMLDGPVMPYHEFVLYQQQLSGDESMAYWSRYLAGAQPSFFPTSGDQAGRQGLDTVRRQVTFDSNDLEEFCGKFSVTPANVCQVAWALVLRSYTGSEDICFSYATSGRDAPLKGINNTVGAFLNAVICRVPVRGATDVPQALIQAKNDYVESLAHQYFTATGSDTQSGDFARLKGNTLMSCQRKAAKELEGSGLGFELIDAVNPNEYDLSINIQTASTGLDVMIDFWHSRIGQATVETVAESFEQAFVSILTEQYATLGEIDVVTPREVEQIRKWGGDIAQRAEYRIQDRFDEQRLIRPDALAVQGWDGDLTYQQLDDEANKLASHLVNLGVRPEIKVPLCFEKSKWAIVSQLAILKAGGAVVPLGTKQPRRRTEIILKDLQATVVLTTEKFAAQFRDAVPHVIEVDGKFMSKLPPSTPPSCAATPDNCAFIIYTSGSTGVPKGVVLPHASLCTSLHHLGARFKLGHHTRTVQFSAYTFDISIQDIYTTLHYGGCLCVISEEDRIHNLAAAMNTYKVNCAGLTSTVAGLIFPRDVPSLTTLVLLGEAVKPAVVDQWIDYVDVFNAYGPSECSMQASTNQLKPGGNALNIGLPFAGSLWVVDPTDYNRLVPIGAPGELLIEGPIQARGYLNDPVKTAAAFVTDAGWMIKKGFGPGRRLYRTGDLVYQNQDGSITYIGRRDTQIKVRGQRVEVGEIEHHLLQQDAVLDAAILYPRQGPCQDRLVGLLTLKDFFSGRGSTSDILPVSLDKLPVAKGQISSACHELTSSVPEHMIPKVWIPLQSMMPQNDSSKLDRKRLGQWVESLDHDIFEALTSSSNMEHQSREPESLFERQVQNAWADVLRLPLNQVPIEQKSFLSLGGDSITAMHVVSWLRARGISLGVRNVLESKSIVDLALVAQPTGAPQASDEPFPLSASQEWYLESMIPREYPLSSEAEYRYINGIFLVPRKRLESVRVAQATRALVSRHPMLRSRFDRDSDKNWRQKIAVDNDTSYYFKAHVVRNAEEAEAVLMDTQKIIDLRDGPIFLTNIIEIESERGPEQLIFMAAHRLAVDNASWAIIRRDLELILQNQIMQSATPLSFQDWVGVEAERSKQLVSEPTVLPFELPPASMDYWGLEDNCYKDERIEAASLDTHTTLLLLGQANDAIRTEPVEILLAAFIDSFQKVFPNRSVPAVFNSHHGRDSVGAGLDVSGTVGCFTYNSPLAISVESSDTAVDILKRTKDVRRSVLSRGQPYSSPRPFTPVGGKASADYPPIEVFLNFADHRDTPSDDDSLLILKHTPETPSFSMGGLIRRPSVLGLGLSTLNGELHIELSFNSLMRHKERMQNLAQTYAHSIRCLVNELQTAAPVITASDFPLLRITPESLQNLQDKILSNAGIRVDEIEDIYPCSPIQLGILMSQIKAPSEYYIQQSFEVLSTSSSAKVDIDRLLHAWRTLVNRHPMLRTRFVPSSSGSGDHLFDQVVLKRGKAEVEHQCCGEDELASHLSVKAGLTDDQIDRAVGHKLTVYSTPSGRTYAQIIISHALVDASSLMLLQVELAQSYDGKPYINTTGPHYSDYISYLQQTSTDEAVNYWTTKLADAEPCHLPSLLSIPTQSNDAPSATHRETLQTTMIDLDFMSDVMTFSENYGVTMANIFQLGWALVLSQFTGSTDVSFGYLSSGRDVPVEGVQGMVGPLINMMVTHIKLNPDFGVQQSLQQLQETFFESFQYQRAPLIRIWNSLQLQGKSLFNTALSYRHVVSSEKENLSLKLDQIVGEDPTEYDATVNVFASEAKTSVSLQYAPNFLSSESANHLLDCLQQGIRSLIAEPSSPIRTVNIATPRDIAQVRKWNDEIADVDGQVCIHDLVSRQRFIQSDVKAVCAWDGDLTYAELDDMASRLAHHLVINMGVGPEVMVALCLDKSRWAIIAQLGVLKAGGCVVSLNPKHPTQRLEVILQDIEAKVILTTEQYSSRYAPLVPHVLSMNADFFSRLPANSGPACQTVNPANAAFIIYTSGSTGTPKGVILTHLALCSSFQAHGKVYQMSPETRSLQFASYTFDASISDIWGTITHGGCVCVISEEERMNNLQQVIESYNVTHAQLTPTVAGLLDVSTIKSLNTLVLGGEAVKEAMVEEYAKAAGRVRVLNGYGPSECSIYTTCGAPLVENSQAPNIGRPLVGSLWIVANNNKICPVGAVGELWVEGPLLARGYLNDQKKTDSSFVSNPTWAKAIGLEGHRFYRTGDLVRQTLNGDIIYHARKDSQVKIRGQRVEVGEIEYRVKKLVPEVKSVVATLVTPNGNSSTLLVAVAMELDDSLLQRHLLSDPIQEVFLPCAPHLRTAFSQLLSALADVLPSYMLPKLFVPVVQLPQTTSGKLDRRSLRHLLETLPQDTLSQYSLSGSSNVVPSTVMEKRLQALWAKVLNIDSSRIGVHDHFLHVGGDSFTAMRLVSAANASGLSLTVADVFRHPKLQDMAAYLDEASLRQKFEDVPKFSLWEDASAARGGMDDELKRVADICGIDVDEIDDIYPCTPLQEGLMAITSQQPRAYIGRWVFRLSASTEIHKFKDSWNRLVRDVPILRTRIVTGQQSGALQVVVRKPLAWIEAEDIQSYLEEDIKKSCNYGSELLRLAIIATETAETADRFFVLTAHHSVYDGWSLGKLFDAMASLYEGNDLSPAPSFTRFIQYLESGNKESAREFWRSQLGGEIGAPFPSMPRPSYRPQPSQTMSSSIQIPQVDSLNTIASWLRAAWALAVAAHSGNDVLFGVALSGRAAPVPGVLDMLAPTITTVPVRINIDPNQTVQDYLTTVHQQAVDMIPFEHTGLHHIRRLVGHEVEVPHLFAVQPAQEREQLADEALLILERGLTPELALDGYALTVECVTGAQNTNTVDIEVHFDSNVIPVSQLQGLLHRFQHISTQLSQAQTTAPGETAKRLGEIEMLSPEELAQIAHFNREVPSVNDALVHDLVYQQALLQPDAQAVCSWDGDLTHAELDDLAETLASYLITLGVQVEDMVALCLDKSKWALVSNLAVLKAGAAVVPVRAEPVQRVQAILQDTSIRIVLTTSDYATVFEDMVPHVLVVDDTLISSIPIPPIRANPLVSPTNKAFVIYTSGSTGTPKGVVIEHGAMSTSMQAHGRRFGMNPQTRAFNFAHFTFDISLHDIITPLQFGGCVCFPSEQERVNDLAGAMQRLGVNYSFLPPRVIHTIRPSEIPALRTLVVGGEAVQAEHLEPWLHGARVFNAYGPAECCIASTCNEVTDRSEASNIGTAIAGGLWVVKESDYNRLVPLGAVGELLLEGPLLARGYLNDQVKTAKAFVSNPAWISQLPLQPIRNPERRMYRTGDLVRQTQDGSLIYISRSDGQVKIRGQRVEIGEIEHHLTEHPAVVEAVVIYPRSGPSNSQLVGILTLRDFIPSDIVEGFEPTVPEHLPSALAQMSTVRQHVTACVPEYMVPQVWVSLSAMPHNTSDKIDRRTLTQWLETMEQDYFERVTRVSNDGSAIVPATSLEANIQTAWAGVLHLPLEKVSLDRPFLSIGGDSITAMQVVSRCRAKYGIHVAVRDVLQSQSIPQLALKAKVKTSEAKMAEVSNSPFGLSPAQSLYFDSIAPHGLHVDHESHFNQSACLVTQRPITVQELTAALEALVAKHSALRSRYKEIESGFSQQIPTDVKGSFHLGVHELQSLGEFKVVAERAQRSLNLTSGPVFSADFVTLSSEEQQILFLTAHHLVVDLVSWGILIGDLELLISDQRSLAGSEDISFESWTRLQTEHIQTRTSVEELLPTDPPIQDWSYWDLPTRDNTYGSRITEHLLIDENTTAALLSEEQALKTKPVEILLAALFHSFKLVFPNRDVPVIFNESRGRDTWTDTIDLSGTVGCFTALSPIYVSADMSDLIDILRRTKDTYRHMATTSLDYFASRYLTEAGRQAFGSHSQAEVMFKYSGRSKGIEHNSTVFRLDESLNVPSIGDNVRRPAVFEIESYIEDSQLALNFHFSEHMGHRDSVRHWVEACYQSLKEIVDRLSTLAPEYTLSDFPLLDVTYDDLDELQKTLLPRAGIDRLVDVEDIYPCSPIQQGILMSQIKDVTTYQVRQAGKIKAIDSTTSLDLSRLLKAWEEVVRRHSILRTIFIPATSGEELFYQVVLKSYVPTTPVIHLETADDFLSNLAHRKLPEYDDGQPPYQIALYPTSKGEVFAQLDVNHALMDASSMTLILNDLILAYDHELPHTPAPSYGEYVSFLRQSSASDSVQYWTNRLANAQPCYFPPSPIASTSGRVLRSAATSMTDLKSIFRFRDVHGVTIANIVQLAWALVLSRYIGTDDVIFGYLANGRDAPIEGIHEMVGPMINMMVTRVQLGNDLTVSQAAKQVQDDFLGAFNHQRTSLGDIQHALRLSEQNLFNTTMVYKRNPIQNSENGMSLTIDGVDGADSTEYDLQIKLAADDETISVDLEYASTFLDDNTAQKLLSSLQSALHSITSNDNTKLSEIDILPTSDVELLHAWNSTVAETVPGCVHDKIQLNVVEQPDSPAVCSWDGNLSFRELGYMADQLASHLRSLGAREEVKVGLCFDKSMWTVVSMLAVLKCGAIIVPLGVQLPLERLRLILEDTAAPVVLTMGRHITKFQDLPVKHVVEINTSFFESQLQPGASFSQPSLTSASAAVVIYTSGSTGRPKGVILTHGSLCTSIDSHGSKLGLGPATRSLQYSAYVFDISLLDIFSTLLFGGCVCVVSEEDRVDINNLAATMEAMKVNFAVLTPTVASLIDPKSVPSLSTLVLAGEAVQPAAVEAWTNHVTIFNGYGPAECSILATINGPITEKESAPSIGFALAGSLWVADLECHSRLVPIGVVGELLISGPLLAREYLNDAERTSQSFITDPTFIYKHGFEIWAGHRMYRTGDLVRQDPTDGSLTYIGRADGQVKIRGQRVEVGEIEHCVKRHFLDSQTVAAELIKPHESGDISLAVAVEIQVDASDQPPSIFLPVTDVLRESFLHLQANLTRELPSYMVPSKYIPVCQMPLTASGKLDRRSLRSALEAMSEEQFSQYGLSEASILELSTDTERHLATLWTEALTTSRRISADAHFFRSGGDSVTAMRLVALARKANPPFILSVGDIFKNPVLSAMANALETSISNDFIPPTDLETYAPPFSLWAESSKSDSTGLLSVASECGVTAESIEDIYPCTPLQEGLMAITAQHPQAYISRWLFRITEEIDIDRFHGAWERLSELAPILRTRIIQHGASGVLQVVVRNQATWTFTSSDVESYITEDTAEPMGFGDALMRFAVSTGPAGRFFIWTAHHSVYDGWTARKLLEAASKIYVDQSALSFLPFTGFVKYLRSGFTEVAREYWQTQLRGGMGPSFPEVPKTYLPGPSQNLQRRIMAQTTSDEFTVSTLLRATWALILSQETGSQNVAFATALSGRTAPVVGILDIMGPTITTVPVRVALDPSQAILDYLSMIQQQAIDMLPFEHTGLQNIRQLVPDPNFTFQHLFVVQPSVDRQDHIHSTFAGLTPVPFEATDFYSYPLVVECSTGTHDENSFIDLQVQFDPLVLPREKLETVVERFEHVLSQLQAVACGHARNSLRVANISLISPKELHRLQEWNQFNEDMTRADACVHDLVHQQRLSHPDSPAVCAWDGNLTYRELDQLASQLAYNLASMGVGPEVAVATVFKKTKWAVVTYLAVLKAGGIIVPINHQHPTQRVQHIVNSIKTQIILTSQNPSLFDGVAPNILKVDDKLLAELSKRENWNCQDVLPSTAAFIIFTSGSTGVPKGVVLEHGAIVSSMKAHGAFYASPSTRALQFSAFNFDISIAEIFTTLAFGGCICVISEDDRVSRLADAMEEFGVNFAILTPTIANLMKPQEVPSLQKMLLVGEALRPEVAVPWAASHVELFNAYGPAESSILTTFSSPIKDPSQAPNIGRALAHSNLWVVDPLDYHQLMPVGAIGELLIEGPLLAREYLGDGQKTVESFVTEPAWLQQFDFGPTQNRRFYRTGDLVQQNVDGSLVYVGRRDTQVKIHGQRVEIGEIEHWIKVKLPDVHEAVVGLFQPPDDGHEPVLAVAVEVPGLGDVVGSPHSLLPPSESLRGMFTILRQALLQVLPAHMVPHLYLPLSKLPLTDSGKLNRRATWEIVEDCSSWAQYFLSDGIKIAPSTDTERELQSLWATVLKVPIASVGATDDFFRSGGDSISAMRLVANARETFQLTLKVADVFRYPVLSEIASVIDRQRGEMTNFTEYQAFSTLHSSDNSLPDSLGRLLSIPATIDDAAPVTDLQALAISVSLRKSRDLMAYLSIDGDGTPDIARWKASCTGLVKCHEILRTAYVCHNDQLVQVVLDSYEPGITTYETEQTIEDFSKHLIAQDMHRAPCLGRPFLEFAIITSKLEARHRILFRLSHAEYDAISLSYLLNTLQELYQRQPTTQYPSFTRYMHIALSQKMDSSREYWRNLLKDCSMPRVGRRAQDQRLLPARQIYHGAQKVQISKPLPAGITLSTIIRAAWAHVLGMHVGSSDVMFGEVVSGRNTGDLIVEKAVGCCANMVPVRASFNQSWSVLELLHSVQKQLVSRLAHENLGFREILRSCTNLPRETLFTSMLNHLDQASKWTLDLEGQQYQVSLAKTEGAGDVSDVSITSTAGTGYVEIAMGYLEDSLSSDHTEELFRRLCKTVDLFLNGSLDAKLGELPGPRSEENLDNEVSARVFEGDLVDASVVAFTLQQRGMQVTMDDVIQRGLTLDV